MQDAEDLAFQLACATYALMIFAGQADTASFEIGSALLARYENSADVNNLTSSLILLRYSYRYQTQILAPAARISRAGRSWGAEMWL